MKFKSRGSNVEGVSFSFFHNALDAATAYLPICLTKCKVRVSCNDVKCVIGMMAFGVRASMFSKRVEIARAWPKNVQGHRG